LDFIKIGRKIAQDAYFDHLRVKLPDCGQTLQGCSCENCFRNSWNSSCNPYWYCV